MRSQNIILCILNKSNGNQNPTNDSQENYTIKKSL